MEYYCFEFLLPYSIRVPTQENIDFLFGEHRCCLVHLKREPTPNGKFVFPQTAYVPADKYGLYFKSRILLVLTSDIVRKLWSAESDEIQKLFPKLDDYVGLLFSNPTAALKKFVFSAVNHFLSIYRVLSQDWHATKVMPKDVSHIVIKKQKDDATTFLTTLGLGDQIMSMSGNDVLPDEQMHLLRSGLITGGKMNSLAALEADIHEKAAQGDFLSACILIGLLAEEAIKEHIVQYVRIRDQTHPDDAEKTIVKNNGKYLSITDLVDKNSKGKKVCLTEMLIGWKPYETDSYANWDQNVRVLRNEIAHAGNKDVNFEHVKLAWLSCAEFLILSANNFIHALGDCGVEMTTNEAIGFYVPLTKEILPSGLFGYFNL